MNERRRAFAFAAASGAALWLIASWATPKREAWDSGLYWFVAYPIAIAICVHLGRRFPERPWRWALALFGAQSVTMALLSGEIGNLFPMGIIAFGVISIPGILAAKWAARRAAS